MKMLDIINGLNKMADEATTDEDRMLLLEAVDYLKRQDTSLTAFESYLAVWANFADATNSLQALVRKSENQLVDNL